jgi:hypothetical protein
MYMQKKYIDGIELLIRILWTIKEDALANDIRKL